MALLGLGAVTVAACSQVIGLNDLTRIDSFDASCEGCNQRADAQARLPPIADANPGSDANDANRTADARANSKTDASGGADASFADASLEIDATAPPASPLGSCLELLQAGATKNGVYEIDIDGSGPSLPFNVYCEMSIEGGGFTLALKADGGNPTFLYDSPLWTNTSLLNETNANLDSTEGKFQSFVSMPISDVLLGIRDLPSSGPTRYLRIPVNAANLRELFSGPFVPTTSGRSAWRQLMPNGSLQYNCNSEGFNNKAGGKMHLRLGIISDERTNCYDPNSFIGIGYASDYSWCTIPKTKTACGNVCSCVGDNGKLDSPAFATLYVRRN
jgi:hypothetical protein